MSYFQQQNRHKLTIGHDGNALTMLIAINLIVFVILAFIKVVYYFSEADQGLAVFYRGFFEWVTLPADWNIFLTRPWTILSHMFVHDTQSIWHIVGNLIWLWVFGYILQDLSGNRSIFPVFLYGAIAGAIAYMVAFNVIPPLKEQLPLARAFGASAGIMAIAIATTTLAPNYRLFQMLNGGIPIWVITVIYLVLDLAMIPEGNAGGHIAHIAGGIMGFVFMSMMKKGHDWGLWMNNVYDWTTNLFDPEKPKKGKVVKSQLFYKSKVKPYTKTALITQQKIDELLDKINQKGYHSLTDDEKEILKRASQEDML